MWLCYAFLALCFFANDLLLAIYFILILDYGYVRQKANSSDFLIRVQNRSETTCNINNAFGSGPANERIVRWWFKRSCKGEENSEDEEHCAGHWKLTTTNSEQPSKLILLQLHKKSPKNSMATIRSVSKANWTGKKA